MKSAFFEPAVRRMAALSTFLFLSGLAFAPFVARGAQATWNSQDHGSFFSTPPVIDATNFINRGTWNINVSPFPFKTSDTLNYTNYGTMQSFVGWRFDLGPASSGGSLTLRSTAGSFFNDNNGVIQSEDGLLTGSWASGVTLGNYLFVSATNIVNKGTLMAGSSGQLLLFGTNVDLHRSTVEIVPVGPSSGIYPGGFPIINAGGTNIIPDLGFTYRYWAQTNMVFNSRDIWSRSNLTVPIFGANGTCGTVWTAGGFTWPFTNTASAQYIFYTNRSNGDIWTTNIVQGTYDTGLSSNATWEAVFIIPPTPAIANANFTAQARFRPPLNITNVFDIVAVRLAQIVTNLITLSPQTNELYLVDSLASSTNSGFLIGPPDPSSGCSTPQLQPKYYMISRSDLNLGNYPTLGLGSGYAFAGGLSGNNGRPPNNFLYDGSWTNNSVIASYAALDTVINNITAPAAAGVSIDHAGGRVQIHAGNLNLSQTRMSGESWIQVQCRHLVGSAGAVVDCPNLSFDLGSTNGSLIFTNLALPTVNHFQGTVPVWSATWSNLTSVSYQPLGSTNHYTNSVIEHLYVLVVDARNLGEPVPVNVVDLHLHGTNITIGDSVVVTNSFFMDGQSLTIQKSIQLTAGVQNWVWTNAPTLRCFTNNGSLTIPNNAHFGDDGPSNYLAFVNNGTISAGGQVIDSVNLQINKGTNNARYSDFDAYTQTGQLASAGVYARNGAIQFFANSLQISNSTLSAYDFIDFTVTNVLSDGGSGSANSFYCENGFNLWTRPAAGDLLYTSIFDTALGQSEVDHTWAGQDAGPVAVTNHSVINYLALYPASSVLKPLFAFYGATGTNGLYVKDLDLYYLTDFTNELYIDSSLTIYYGSAVLNPNVDTTGYSSAEAYLNNNPNLFGARLQWVPAMTSLAKPQPPALNQKLQLTVGYNAASGGFQLASANLLLAQTNIIEASTNLVQWAPIYTNIGSYTNVGVSTIPDQDASHYPRRFYRAVPMP